MNHKEFAAVLARTLFLSQYSVSEVIEEMPEDEIERLRTILSLSIFGYLASQYPHCASSSETVYQIIKTVCDGIDVADLHFEIEYEPLFLDILTMAANPDTLFI